MQSTSRGADLLLVALCCLILLLRLLGSLEAGLGLHGMQVRLLGMRQRLESLVVVVLQGPYTQFATPKIHQHQSRSSGCLLWLSQADKERC